MENQNKKISITVKILNQSYDVYCDENEREMLIKSAELLNDKMMKTKAEGKTIGLDRIAVIAALNFTKDSLSYKDITNSLNSSVKNRVSELNHKLDNLISE